MVGRLGNQLEYLSTASDAAWRYDIEQRRWRELAPMPTARGALGTAIVGDTLYAVGGRDVPTRWPRSRRYDLKRGTWSTLSADPRAGRDHLGVAALGGFVYAVGGRYDGGEEMSRVPTAANPRGRSSRPGSSRCHRHRGVETLGRDPSTTSLVRCPGGEGFHAGDSSIAAAPWRLSRAASSGALAAELPVQSAGTRHGTTRGSRVPGVGKTNGLRGAQQLAGSRPPRLEPSSRLARRRVGSSTPKTQQLKRGLSGDGRGWFRTSDLSRVKRALSH